jgi:hypothetical protein
MPGDLKEINPRLYHALEFAFKLHGRDAHKLRPTQSVLYPATPIP